MKFHALCLLGLTLGIAETAPAQNIPAELNGKLVALRGKAALPFAALICHRPNTSLYISRPVGAVPVISSRPPW